MKDKIKSNPSHRPPAITGALDADQIMVIPDTPDRIPKRNSKGICLSAASSSRESGLENKGIFGKSGQSFDDSLQNWGVHSLRRCKADDISQSYGAGSSVVGSATSKNDLLPGRLAGKPFKRTGSHHFNNQLAYGEKLLHPRLPGIPHHHDKGSGGVSVENGEVAKFSFRTSGENFGAEKMRERFLHANNTVSLHTVGGSSDSTRNYSKEKMKVGDDKPGQRDAHDNVAQVASNHNTGKIPPMTQLVGAPRMVRRKRLVRNGCISPHNIEKAKLSEESSVNCSADAENIATSCGFRHVIDVDDVIAKRDAATRAKGKGVVVSPYSSNGWEDRKSGAGCFADERPNGKFCSTGSIIGQDNNSNSNETVLGKHSLSSGSSAFKPVVLLEDLFGTPSSSSKRQRRHGSTSCNPEKSADVICLSSGGKSSTAKSNMVHGARRVLGSPVEVAELFQGTQESESQTEARDIQLQADEMLARELQEQLYNEIPDAPSGERGSLVTRGHHMGGSMELQLASSRGNHHRPTTGGFHAPNTRRQSHSQSLRNRLFGGRTRARFPTSTSTVTRLRSRIRHHTPSVSSEERDRLFPSNMDFDMRMELLEALEAVFNDDVRMVNQLLDSDREFNENDYETLLALDENNHEHLGASVVQIANLPESTVHNASNEACSICLETPTMGDKMRHLPCLHKFHKDCIDPWLRRKRSCPVCKFDVI